MSELRYAKERRGARMIRFLDSVISLRKSWLLPFLERYSKEIALPFFCNLHASLVDQGMIQPLVEAGLVKTVVGIQSASEPVRRLLNRFVSNEAIHKLASALVAARIPFEYHLIGWDPFETVETLEEGLDFLETLPSSVLSPDASAITDKLPTPVRSRRVVVFQLETFAGSPLEEKFDREKPTPLSFEQYHRYALLAQMMLRSNQLKKAAKRIRSEQRSYTPQELSAMFTAENMAE